MATLSEVQVRDWNESDRLRLFEWRNRPEIVSLGASQRTVSWEEHCAWFARLVDGNRYWVRIVEIGGVAAGCVRLERSGEIAEITIYLDSAATGRGYGVRVIRQACNEASQRWPELRFVRASIRSDNRASRVAFERAGFGAALPRDGFDVLLWAI